MINFGEILFLRTTVIVYPRLTQTTINRLIPRSVEIATFLDSFHLIGSFYFFILSEISYSTFLPYICLHYGCDHTKSIRRHVVSFSMQYFLITFFHPSVMLRYEWFLFFHRRKSLSNDRSGKLKCADFSPPDTIDFEKGTHLPDEICGVGIFPL